MSTNGFEEFNTSNNIFSNPFGSNNNPDEESNDKDSNPFDENSKESEEDIGVLENTSEESTNTGEKKKRGRKKREEGEAPREMAPRLDAKQKEHIIRKYAELGSEKLAAELQINVNQVRHTISKFRKDALSRIEKTESEEEKAKLQKFIDIYLPERVRGESASRGPRTRKSSNQNIIDDLLKDIGL